MSEEFMAANADVQDVSTSEGIATPQETQVSGSANTEVQGEQDITQTQAFAHRLKEATERARQEARDSWIAEQGYEWNGKPIKTEAEYKQAIKEKELFESYQSKGLPEEVVNDLVELKKFREETLAERQARESQEQKAKEEQEKIQIRNSMFDEFFEEYKEYADPEKSKGIPKEVLADAQKWLQTNGREGRRLVDAMIRYERGQRIAEEQKAQANQANAQASTGSVKGNGLPDSGFISREVYEANKGNQSWMMKNYETLTKSMKKWGK